MNLDGQTAIVTGGTRGLGWAIAQTLAAAGATVVCTSRAGHAREPLPPALAERLLFERLDVNEPEAIRAVVERTVNACGSLDVLVANAGVNYDATIARINVQRFEEMMRTNVTGTMLCVQAAAPHLRGHGRVVTVSSSMATHTTRGTAGYASSKAAIEQFTRVAATELGKDGIRVNCIAPGPLDAGMGSVVMSNPKLASAYLPMIALGRPGRATEAAEVVLFLASTASSYITGAVIPVTGGLS